MWYSSFWSEGPKNHQNLKILVSKFVPRGFEARRTWGFEAQQHGVLRGGGGVSRGSNMGPGGTATSGMGPQGAAEGPRGTATWDRVIEGIFFYISVQQILNLSQSGEELCGASQAVQTDGHLFH